MKLQKLIIENIASIEKACIDFEHGPLGEDSIFLICGPTGAGKSTLLDAVCLALYNTTPRLKQAANERYLDENDSFSGTGEVSIDDSRMLMRRDSVSAQVELWFTDAAGDALRAVERGSGAQQGWRENSESGLDTFHAGRHSAHE